MKLLILIVGLVVAVGGTILYMRGRTAGKARIIDDDVFVDLWVTPDQVARNETIEIEDPMKRGETIRVSLPEISGARIALRMEGRGVEGRGDLFINVKVRTPYGRV